LNNERIDIVLWSSQPQVFVTKALAPAKIVNIVTFPGEDRMTVVVDDEKLSLAIGKAGQNARLAAKLTGWKINILSETEYRAMKEAEEIEKVDLDLIEGVTPKMQLNLSNAGFDTAQDIVNAPPEKLLEVEGVGSRRAEMLITRATEAIERRKLEVGAKALENGFSADGQTASGSDSQHNENREENDVLVENVNDGDEQDNSENTE